MTAKPPNRALADPPNAGCPPRVSSTARAEPPELVSWQDRDGWPWIGLPDWQEALARWPASRWRELAQDDAESQLIKRGLGRETWRVALDDTSLSESGKSSTSRPDASLRVVYAKVFGEPRGAGDRLKGWLLGSSGHREWRDALTAWHGGVDAVRPVACGWASRLGASVVLFEEVPKSVTLMDYWQRRVVNADPQTRRQRVLPLIDPLARLFAQAARATWRHRDAHAGNILLSWQRDSPTARFADVRGARSFRFRRDPERVAHALMGQFAQYFTYIATTSEKRRFLRRLEVLLRAPADDAHDAATPLATLPTAGLLGRVRRAIARQREKLARQRDRRLRRRSDEFFYDLTLGPFQVRAVLRLGRQHVFHDGSICEFSRSFWRRNMERLFEPARPCDDDIKRRAVIGKEGFSYQYDARPEHPEKHRFDVRVMCAGSRLEAFGWRLAGSPARRFFIQQHKLRHRDVRCVPPLGWAEHSPSLLQTTMCVLIMPDVSNQEDQSTRPNQADQPDG